MEDQAKEFARASGKLSMLLYKDEIEASLRTYPYGGFQILEARDYPGQGTAIVGWLDAFWDSKGLISRGIPLFLLIHRCLMRCQNVFFLQVNLSMLQRKLHIMDELP